MTMRQAIRLVLAIGLVWGLWLAVPLHSADDTMDWLLDQATTLPASQPAGGLPQSRPAAPFSREQAHPEARNGTITLSNGRVIRGQIHTTPEKPIRIWDDAAKEYRDVPFALIKSLEAKVLWERQQEEWQFRESGSDVKVFSGRTYPARELIYTVTLINDQQITGGIVAPLYGVVDGETADFVLYKRQKGPIGSALADLVYVRRVELED